MSQCLTCGRRASAQRDFCECGEFLGWDHLDDSAPTDTAESNDVGRARVRLNFVGESPNGIGVAAAAVRRRRSASGTRRTSRPTSRWWSRDCHGNGGQRSRLTSSSTRGWRACFDQQDAAITFAPLHDPQALAGSWPLQIQARRVGYVGEHGADGHAELRTDLAIEAYSEIDAELARPQREGFRRGLYELVLEHRGNRVTT